MSKSLVDVGNYLKMYCVECNKMMIFLYKHLGGFSPSACENKVEGQALNKVVLPKFACCLRSYGACPWEVGGLSP